MPSAALRRARPLAVALLIPLLSLAVAAIDPAPAPRVKDDKAVKPMTPVEMDKALIAEVKANTELMKNLQYLSDVIGPRLTGSKNLEKANKWTADKMREYGLENVKLESWEIPVGWERGPASMTIIEPETNRQLGLAAVGWTPGTKGKVTGEVVILRGRNRADLDYYKGKLKNAVVMMSPPPTIAPVTNLRYLGDPPPLPKKEDFFPPKKDEPKKDDPKKDEKKLELKKDGLSPISFEQPPAKDDPKKDDPKKDDPKKVEQKDLPPIGQAFMPTRELDAFLIAEGAACKLSCSSKPHGLLVAYGGWRGADRGEPEGMMPQVVVAHEHYSMLWRLASRPAPDVTKVEIQVSNKFIPGPITVFNTVGEVRGSEKPDEFVVVGAHLDSWDLGTGTTDNGTGTCVVLESARTVAALAKRGYPPKRTIRFCLFTGEEQGLYGSREYVKRHMEEMPKTSACLVHDTGTGKMIGWGLANRKESYKILEPELATLFELDGWRGCDLGFQGGSDHQSFDRRDVGVPGFCGRQEGDEYRLTHHTQTDTFDKAKPDNLNQGAQVMSVTCMRIANLPNLLPRER
ncbi:MAG TPA: M28 family peptidase [Gemmataceae bacterium]|nr:M28 family peptidase [Gemmataceae bacterium]